MVCEISMKLLAQKIKQKKPQKTKQNKKSRISSPTCIHDKNFSKPETEGNFLNLIRNIYKKNPTTNIILNVEKLRASPTGLPWWHSG